MRVSLLLILLFFFLLLGCTPEPKLTDSQKLATLAKVWGFLKYYHPVVASGKLNWDQELITHLPKVKAAQSKEELSQIYIEWIGELEKSKVNGTRSSTEANRDMGLALQQAHKSVAVKETFDENFNLSWTDNKVLFTEELIQVLDGIEQNRARSTNHYLRSTEHGFAGFQNEAPYSELYFKYPGEAYRLLSLFRYWNIIEYFFPYKYQTDQAWSEVLLEMIPKFKDAKNLGVYHLALLELVAKVNDSHAELAAELAPDVFGHYWLPARFKLVENKVVITSFVNDSLARAQDLQIGDVLYRVNKIDVGDIVKRKIKYMPASNQAALHRDIYYAVFNGVTDAVTLTIERNGILKENRVKRYLFNELNIKPKSNAVKSKRLEGNIGYVNMGLLEVPEVAKVMQDLAVCNAIIFDVRNYPNGTMHEVAKYLLPAPREFARLTIPDLTYPGKYKWITGKKAGTYNRDAFKGKVVVLADETTQSQAEFTVLALQTADNATVIGSQTAGTDGSVIYFELVGGYKTRMTGVGVFYPDKTETQRIGIVPDVVVKPTIAGIRAGKDEVLEKALEYIRQGK